MMHYSDDPTNRKNKTLHFGVVTRFALSKKSIEGKYSPHVIIQDDMLTLSRLRASRLIQIRHRQISSSKSICVPLSTIELLSVDILVRFARPIPITLVNRFNHAMAHHSILKCRHTAIVLAHKG